MIQTRAQWVVVFSEGGGICTGLQKNILAVGKVVGEGSRMELLLLLMLAEEEERVVAIGFLWDWVRGMVHS